MRNRVRGVGPAIREAKALLEMIPPLRRIITLQRYFDSYRRKARHRKTERKKLQVEHAAAKSERAKILKLADKTSNLRSLVKSPPTDWSPQRRQEYLDWALEVAKGLRWGGVNPWLEAQFEEAVEQLAKLLRTA